MEEATAITSYDEREQFVFLAQIALKEMIPSIESEFVSAFNFPPELGKTELAFVAELHAQLTLSLENYRKYCQSFVNYAKGANTAGSPFRQCPYCPLVWIKVEGCDGKTTCGNRPTISEKVML